MLANNPYAALRGSAGKERRPASAYGGGSMKKGGSVRGGSARRPMIRATGQVPICPGVGPFLPQGAAKHLTRPMYKGKPKPTGVFDSQTVFQSTRFTEKYHQGDIPCQIDMKGSDEEKPGGPPGGRALKWKTPIKELNLEIYLPIFIEGLREQVEP